MDDAGGPRVGRRRGFGRRAEAGVVGVIVVVALLVRLATRTGALPVGVNADEFAWTWAGQSLILQHSPSSWSYLVKPVSCPCVIDPASGQSLPYVHPWLDHPPVFALLVGGVAVLAGETSTATVSPAVIRVVPDVLSVVTLVLGYLLARRLGRVTAVLFAVMFAVAPTMVLASSLVEAEWLVAPMLLGGLLLAGSARRGALVALVTLCLLAPLVKESGVLVALSVAAVLGAERRWRRAGVVLAAGAGGALLVMAWAWLIDWQRFLAILHAQATRHGEAGGGQVAFLLDTRAAYGGGLAMADPLWYLGVGAALVALAVAWRRGRPQLWILVLPLAVTAALMALVAPSTAFENGWYRIAVYPLVYLAAAWLLVTGARAAWGRRSAISR